MRKHDAWLLAQIFGGSIAIPHGNVGRELVGALHWAIDEGLVVPAGGGLALTAAGRELVRETREEYTQ